MSDTFDLDLSGYVNTRGSYVPEGKYLLVVEDVDTMTSSAGNPMWKVMLSVVDGEHKGETLVDFITITSKAMFRVVAFLNAIGVPTPKKNLSIPKSMMVGKMFEATTEDNFYKGEKGTRIASYASITQPGSGDLPDDEEDYVPANAPDPLESEAAEPDPGDEADEAPVTEVKAAPKTNARQQPAKPSDDDLDL